MSTGTPVTYAAQAGCGSVAAPGAAGARRPKAHVRPEARARHGGRRRRRWRVARRPAGRRDGRRPRGVVRVQPPARLARLRRARAAYHRNRRPRRSCGPSRARAWRRRAARRSARDRSTQRQPSSNRAARQSAPLDDPRARTDGPKTQGGPADGARRCGQPRVLRGRGAQDWYHRDAHFADGALSSPPTCGQNTVGRPSARVRARPRARGFFCTGKTRRSNAAPLSPHKSTRAGATRCTFRRWCPTPGLPRSHPSALAA